MNTSGRPIRPLAVLRLYTLERGALAQLGERRLCKPEVTGSIPVRSITFRRVKSAIIRMV